MTTSTKKVTKAQRNADIMAMLKGESVAYGTTLAEAIAHLERENELLAKKSGADRKPTATQIANEGYKALILDHMSKSYETVSDIIKAIPEFDGFTPQKVAPLVKSLLDAGFVEKKVEKGRSYFCKAGE